MTTELIRWTRRLLIAAAFIGGIVTVGCDSLSPIGCACTTDFRFFSATIVDGLGEPVVGAELTVTRARDGFTFDVNQDFGFGDTGAYVILSDSHKRDVRRQGELVRVLASKEGSSVTATYVFGRDDCDCHIAMIAGPDTIVLGGGT